MANPTFRPLGDRVLVQPIEEGEVKKGGIIIPDTAKEKPQEAKVIAIGTGKLDDDGKKLPFEVKVGDRVLISKYGGTEIKIDGTPTRCCARTISSASWPSRLPNPTTL